MGPTKEAEYVDWGENLLAVCQTNKIAWHLSEDKLKEVDTLFTQFKQLHHLCATPAHTPIDMQRKREVKAELTKKMDTFITNELQYTYYVNDEGRVQAGVPVHDRTPTPKPTPDTVPDVETELPFPRTVRIKFRAPGAPRWGKDPHAKGLECRWILADTAPVNIDALPNTEFDSNSPLELTFREEQRGKRVWYAVRWEGTRADNHGPWSDIYSAIVP